MARNSKSELSDLLGARYGDAAPVQDDRFADGSLLAMAGRGSCRTFQATQVSIEVLETLCAVALASPTKSDLQQRDIILLTDPDQRASLAAMVAGQAWVLHAPMLAVFCGNNRRQRLLHQWRDVPFANDHLDAFFNASVDAGIALGAFVTAAEAIGLGCCPISGIRDEAVAVSDMLGLPDHVFPIAGLAIGHPSDPPVISNRLPLAATLHHNRYTEPDLARMITRYDAARKEAQPYALQRCVEKFGHSETYGWSEDKVRQYSRKERAAFGAFVRAKGFTLD